MLPSPYLSKCTTYMNIIICLEFVSNEEASNSFLFGVFFLVYETTVKYLLLLLCKHFIWYIFFDLYPLPSPPPNPLPPQPPFFWKQRDFAEGESFTFARIFLVTWYPMHVWTDRHASCCCLLCLLTKLATTVVSLLDDTHPPPSRPF